MSRKIPPSAGDALTFVVRLWPESDAAGRQHWRGRVENVGTQEVCYVEDGAGVADVITRWMPPIARGGDEQGNGP